MNRIRPGSEPQTDPSGSRSPERNADAPSALDFDAGEYVRFVRRHGKWILSITGIALILGLCFYLLVPARYRSVAEILLDPRGVALAKADPAFQSLGADSNLLDLETQRYLIVSSSVLGAVVDEERLNEDPQFTRVGFIGKLLGSKPNDSREAAIEKLAAMIEVMRGERALILDIIVVSPDPRLSARLANAVARVFFSRNGAAQREAARRAGLALQGRAEQLAQELQDAEAKVERYKSEHDLSETAGKLTAEQQLGDLSYQLGLARSQVAQTRARFEEVTKLQRSKAAVDQLSDAVHSNTISGLRTQYATLVQQKSAMEMQFGPKFPPLIDIQRQIQEVGRLIDAELSRIAGAALSDHRRAQTTEADLESRLAGLKRRSFQVNETMVGLRALERSVEATRNLYQSSLKRAKELEESQEVDSSTSRIITEAVPNNKKAGPPLPLVLGGALICGIGLGSAAGYFRDRMGAKAREPAHASRSLFDLPILADFRVVETMKASERPSTRILRWILGVDRDAGPRTIFFLGLDDDGRKPKVMFEIALAALDRGRRVITLDTNRSGGAACRLWRKEAARLLRKGAGGRDIELVTRWPHDSCFAIHDRSRGSVEFASIAEMIDSDAADLPPRRFWSAFRDRLRAFENADMILVSANAEDYEAFAVDSRSDALLALIDGDRPERGVLSRLAESIGADIPSSAGVVLVGERAAA
ncbi:GumC family protein [Methylosinus sp. Sm6]|uniref:GumC family protein n=1 Tax=Methylosinus sp. Sm6 TaxID=2866948 RepID=UPI001C999FD3|nr:GumC family protein [Methylosinus sp. Sm6]MBY6241987.1 GumC family protein [Methylosinus sp. Sm6]